MKAVMQDSPEVLESGDPDEEGFVFAPFDTQGTPKLRLRPDRFFASPFSRQARLQSPVLPDTDEQAREIHEASIEQAISVLRSGRL